MKINVLISVPNNNPSHVIYLPTIWGVLKSYCDRDQRLRQGCEWLTPVIMKGAAARLLAPYEDTPLHVLGLSCYSWNMQTNLRIAALVRERHPGCLIVAGGPHVDYRNTDLFRAHPQLDAVVLKDGEIPFAMMLRQVLDGRLDLASIPGVVVPGGRSPATAGKRYVAGPPPQLPATLEGSPWLENRDFFEAMMAELRARHPGRPLGIPWEIDRGCPYACTFCDWGSNTASKVRTRSLDILAREADWIARNRIHVNFMTVANFGLKDSDEEVLDAVIRAKQEHGYPRVFIWNNAKNNVERVVSMNERAFHAGIVDFHILSVQSLDSEVLAAMNRAGVGHKVVRQVVARALQANIPCVAQLIFGGPADNRAKFIGSLTGLMELGVHDEYVAYPFDVLPNAPAADPAYRELWGIQTITRRGAVNRRDPNEESEDMSTIIVATRSYGADEFVDMYVDGRLLIALHNGGLTQHLAIFLRRAGVCSFERCYELIREELFHAPSAPWHGLYRLCHAHIAAFVGPGGEQRTESLVFPGLEELDYLFSVEEYFLASLLMRADEFYRDVLALLERHFRLGEHAASLVRYQRAILIDPGYDRRQGRRCALRHDWPRYFAPGAGQAYPARRDVTLEIARSHSGSQLQYPLNWHESAATPAQALQAWARTVIGKHYQRVERSYFKGAGLDHEARIPYYEQRRREASRQGEVVN